MRDWIHLSEPTMAQIASAVAARHGFMLADLQAPGRERGLSWARISAYVEIYRTGRYSTTQIGRFLGRDHTTVAQGIQSAAARAGLPPAPRNRRTNRDPALGLLALARSLAQQEAA